MRDEPVRVVAHDPAWPARFEQERDALAQVLRAWLVGEIEHIGSTAVPGLVAKPVIDIMAGVRDLESSAAAREAAAVRLTFSDDSVRARIEGAEGPVTAARMADDDYRQRRPEGGKG